MQVSRVNLNTVQNRTVNRVEKISQNPAGEAQPISFKAKSKEQKLVQFVKLFIGSMVPKVNHQKNIEIVLARALATNAKIDRRSIRNLGAANQRFVESTRVRPNTGFRNR